jgi:hypothetical protein
MKHLRGFNESLKQELLEFCQDSLAYLLDDGFKVRISKFEGDDFHQIMIGYLTDGSGYGNNNRLWSEMKDQILPFLHFLFKDYELYYDNDSEPAMGIIYHSITSLRQMNLTLEQISDLPDDTEVSTLFIRVIKKGEKVEKAWFRNF